MNKDINLFEVIVFFIRHIKTYGLHFVPVVAVAILISMVLPKSFKSTVVFMPPGSGGSGLSALIEGRIDLDPIGGNKLSKRQYVALLNSRELREDLIRKFDLVKVYKLSKMPNATDLALRRIKGEVTITEEAEGGLGVSDIVTVELSVTDGSAIRAADMANYLYQRMEARAIELSVTEYKRMLEFLQVQGAACDSALESARQHLKAFQISNKAYDVPAQLHIAMQAVALNRAELMTLQKQRAFVGSHITEQSGELRDLDEKIAILDRKNAELEDKVATDVVPGLKMSLSLANTYVDLLKEVETYVQVRVLLRQQEEMARIRSSVNYSTVILVDAARPAQWKSKPKRSLVVGAIVFLYFVSLTLYLYSREGYARLRRDDPEKLSAIRNAFRSKPV